MARYLADSANGQPQRTRVQLARPCGYAVQAINGSSRSGLGGQGSLLIADGTVMFLGWYSQADSSVQPSCGLRSCR